MAAASRAAILAKLEYRREVIAAELVAGPGQSFIMSDGSELTGWKPGYSIDGESISWDAYKDGLYRELEEIDKAVQRLSGPWLVQSRGRA